MPAQPALQNPHDPVELQKFGLSLDTATKMDEYLADKHKTRVGALNPLEPAFNPPAAEVMQVQQQLLEAQNQLQHQKDENQRLQGLQNDMLADMDEEQTNLWSKKGAGKGGKKSSASTGPYV